MFKNMDDECRAVRQRRKQSDPTCCPVCGITVRSHEIEQHFTLEVDRLHKLSIHKNKKQSTSSPVPSLATIVTTKEMTSIVTNAAAVAGCSSLATTSASASASANDTNAIDAKECWNTYQRIKTNRNARLKVNVARTHFATKIIYRYSFLLPINLVEKSKEESRRSIVSGMQ